MPPTVSKMKGVCHVTVDSLPRLRLLGGDDMGNYARDSKLRQRVLRVTCAKKGVNIPAAFHSSEITSTSPVTYVECVTRYASHDRRVKFAKAICVPCEGDYVFSVYTAADIGDDGTLVGTADVDSSTMKCGLVVKVPLRNKELHARDKLLVKRQTVLELSVQSGSSSTVCQGGSGHAIVRPVVLESAAKRVTTDTSGGESDRQQMHVEQKKADVSRHVVAKGVTGNGPGAKAGHGTTSEQRLPEARCLKPRDDGGHVQTWQERVHVLRAQLDSVQLENKRLRANSSVGRVEQLSKLNAGALNQVAELTVAVKQRDRTIALLQQRIAQAKESEQSGVVRRQEKLSDQELAQRREMQALHDASRVAEEERSKALQSALEQEQKRVARLCADVNRLEAELETSQLRHKAMREEAETLRVALVHLGHQDSVASSPVNRVAPCSNCSRNMLPARPPAEYRSVDESEAQREPVRSLPSGRQVAIPPDGSPSVGTHFFSVVSGTSALSATSATTSDFSSVPAHKACVAAGNEIKRSHRRCKFKNSTARSRRRHGAKTESALLRMASYAAVLEQEAFELQERELAFLRGTGERAPHV